MKLLYSILVFFLILLSEPLKGQDKRLLSAHKQFHSMNYSKAIEAYEKYLEKSDATSDFARSAYFNLAECYRKLGDYAALEETTTEMVKNFPTFPQGTLFHAQALAYNRKYIQSQDYYTKYSKLAPNDSRGKRFSKAYLNWKSLLTEQQTKISNLSINSEDPEFAPMYYKKGLVFCSTGSSKKRKEFLDIVYVTDTLSLLRNSTDTNVEDFSSTLNTKYHEGPVTFFKNERTIIFTRNSKPKKGGDEMVQKLFIAELNPAGEWDNIRELPFNGDTYSTSHPALNADNSKLYFTSNRPESIGGFDLYSVDYKGGNWGTPINLGRSLNTEGDEMFPFIDENGTLYFSSNGWAGLGGLDLFRYNLGSSEEPKNMGPPLNSVRDDFSFICKNGGTSGYFSSNRESKASNDDNLYSFYSVYQAVTFTVLQENTNEKLGGATITLTQGDNSSVLTTNAKGIATAKLSPGLAFEAKIKLEDHEEKILSFKTTTLEKGQKSLKLLKQTAILTKIAQNQEAPTAGSGAYTVANEQKPPIPLVDLNKKEIVGKPQEKLSPIQSPLAQVVIPERKTMTNLNPKPEILNSPRPVMEAPKKLSNTNQEQLRRGDIVELDNIYYGSGQYLLPPTAILMLDKLVEMLQKYSLMRIELSSFADGRSSTNFNDNLSEMRAKSVYEYLVLKGINPSRLEIKWHGSTLSKKYKSEGEAKRDRRTEFKILN